MRKPASREDLAERVRRLLGPRKDFTEKPMFGGVCFLLAGKMCCGTLRDDLVVRVGPELYEQALGERHTRPMDFTGRPIRGFVYVGQAGYRKDEDLAKWVERGVACALAQRPKRRRRAEQEPASSASRGNRPRRSR